MDAKLLNDYAQQNAFPILGDATTLGLPGHAGRHSPGWQDLEMAGSNQAAIIWIPPLAERMAQSPIGTVVLTGPSEATVLPITLDATVGGGDGIAYHRCRRCFGAQVYFNLVAGNHFGSSGSEVF